MENMRDDAQPQTVCSARLIDVFCRSSLWYLFFSSFVSVWLRKVDLFSDKFIPLISWWSGEAYFIQKQLVNMIWSCTIGINIFLKPNPRLIFSMYMYIRTFIFKKHDIYSSISLIYSAWLNFLVEEWMCLLSGRDFLTLSGHAF